MTRDLPQSPVGGKVLAAEGFMLKAFSVSIEGFPPYRYYAASRGHALRDSWNAYCSYRPISFKEFLTIARCRREDPINDRFGQPISVGGKPAFFVSLNNQYVQFSRPGGTEYFNAHPYDVEPEEFRPWTYRQTPPDDAA